MGENDPPTAEEVVEIRRMFQEYMQENGKSEFDEIDIQLTLTSDEMIRKYFTHVWELKGNQCEEAYKMIINTLKYRKENNIRHLTDDDMHQDLKNAGVLYTMKGARDCDGKRLLTFNIKDHIKNKDLMNEMKKYFMFMTERLDREENTEQISLVFDCEGAGLRNMDMDFVQFMIGFFKEHKPDPLNYILVYEMPWVLSAAWKVIKAWLPAAAVKKIRFLDKKSVKEYIPDNTRYTYWSNGLLKYEYHYEPEIRKQPEPKVEVTQAVPVSSSLNNNNSPVENNKKVSFSNEVRTTSFASMSESMSTDSTSNSSSSKNLLSISPDSEVIFKQGSNGELTAKIVITNASESPVIFKIKTTSPDKYRVRPSMGCLSAGGSNKSLNIDIAVSPSQAGNPAVIRTDKFLVAASVSGKEGVSNQEITELMKKSRPDNQYRLRCSLSGELAAVYGTPNGGLANGHLAGAAIVEDKQVQAVNKKLSKLASNQEELLASVDMMKKLLIALVVLASLCLIFTTRVLMTMPGEVECPTGSDKIVVTPSSGKNVEL